MQMLVGCDDRGGDLGTREKLLVVRSDEVGGHFFGHELRPIGPRLRDADEVHLREAGGDLAADEAHSPGADDPEPDAISPRVPQPPAPPGISIGRFSAADRSAAWETCITTRACSAVPSGLRPEATHSRKWCVSASIGPA